MGLFSYPVSSYPTIIFGYVSGPFLRWEAIGGEEIFVQKDHSILRNVEPFVDKISGKTWGITHLQKTSRFGFLWEKPYDKSILESCFHFWFFLQTQKKCAHGGWVPASEFGKYFRLGFWRWDPAGTKGQHWIGPLSIYINFGVHWD